MREQAGVSIVLLKGGIVELLIVAAVVVAIAAVAYMLWQRSRLADARRKAGVYNRYLDLRLAVVQGDASVGRPEFERQADEVVAALGAAYNPRLSAWTRLDRIDPALRAFVTSGIDPANEDPMDLDLFAEAILRVDLGGFRGITPPEWFEAAKGFVGDAAQYRTMAPPAGRGVTADAAFEEATSVGKRYFSPFGSKTWDRKNPTAPATAASAAPAGHRMMSPFGLFGPATGLVVAFAGLAEEAPRDNWRLLAEVFLASFREHVDEVNGALAAIQDQRADPMAGTYYIQAERWAFDRFTDIVVAAPDEWFEGLLSDGKPVVVSGIKSTLRDRLVQAAVGLAALPYGPKDASARLYGPATILVPFESVLVAGPTAADAKVIGPFRGLGPDMLVTAS